MSELPTLIPAEASAEDEAQAQMSKEKTLEERIREKIALTRAFHFIQYLRKLSDDLPMQTAHVLFIIANEPGITTRTLMKRSKLSQASCSRNVTRLSHTDRHGRPGFGLVEARPDPKDPRRHLMYLTAKGQEFVAVAADILSGPIHVPPISPTHTTPRRQSRARPSRESDGYTGR